MNNRDILDRLKADPRLIKKLNSLVWKAGKFWAKEILKRSAVTQIGFIFAFSNQSDAYDNAEALIEEIVHRQLKRLLVRKRSMEQQSFLERAFSDPRVALEIDQVVVEQVAKRELHSAVKALAMKTANDLRLDLPLKAVYPGLGRKLTHQINFLRSVYGSEKTEELLHKTLRYKKVAKKRAKNYD